MFSKFITGKYSAVSIAAAAVIAFSAPATAQDWSKMMNLHYSTTEQSKYQPEANSEWGFSLKTVMSDMEWRKKTAAALRNQPRPTVTDKRRYSQLVHRPQQPRRYSAF